MQTICTSLQTNNHINTLSLSFYRPNALPGAQLGWLVGVEFNAPLNTTEVISDAVFTANHLTDTDKQNSTGKYR